MDYFTQLVPLTMGNVSLKGVVESLLSHLEHEIRHIEAKEIRYVYLMKSEGNSLVAHGRLLPICWLMNETALCP